MEVVKPFIDETYRTKSRLPAYGYDWFLTRRQYYPVYRFGIPRQNWLLGRFFHLQTGSTNRYIECQKLSPDQRIFIYVGTEEADDTDKTLMDGNIKQAYIDSSLCYYHDLIAGGVHLIILC